MSLVTLAHICSHLQNCSQARLGLTSVPWSKMSLALMLALQQSGFISTVTRAGPRPPQMLTATSQPHASDPALLDPTHPDTPEMTRENVASRRLWIGLKYWKEMPVLSEMKLVSKPKQRIVLGYKDLERIVRGRSAKYVKGMVRPGECLFLTTDKGIMEAREAAEKKLGGMIMCRVI